MNKETIIGSCDIKGLFKAKNLHPKKTIKGEASEWYKEFEVSHPELLCYNASNELVTDVENVEVSPDPVYEIRFRNRNDYGQYKSWHRITKEQFDNRTVLKDGAWQVRAFYITVPPTEKVKPVCSKCEDVGTVMLDKTWDYCSCEKGQSMKPQFTNEEYLDLHGSKEDAYIKPRVSSQEYFKLPENKRNLYMRFCGHDEVYYTLKQMANKNTTTPLPEAQPLEGVKTAQSILSATGKTISTITHIELLQCMEEYANYRIAQFATDAGGGEQSMDDVINAQMLLADSDVISNRDFTKRCMAAYAAPSTHSSSEMVEKKAFAFTYEQLLTLPWYWGEENGEKFTHNYKPGYDNIDGNTQYFGTSKKGMRIISVNADYAGHTYVEILCDGGTRKGFNGSVRSFDELRLINSLVL